MWDQVSEFLFDHFTIAGFQLENWMWLIGMPVLIFCGYISERGFHRRSVEATAEPNEKSE
jgi:hypothetical protein